jgi:hypothetical protein
VRASSKPRELHSQREATYREIKDKLKSLLQMCKLFILVCSTSTNIHYLSPFHKRYFIGLLDLDGHQTKDDGCQAGATQCQDLNKLEDLCTVNALIQSYVIKLEENASIIGLSNCQL